MVLPNPLSGPVYIPSMIDRAGRKMLPEQAARHIVKLRKLSPDFCAPDRYIGDQMEFSPENVESAVQQFYQSNVGQAEINRWLTTAQLSPSAWSFASQLIQPQKSAEVQFFGANTLHVKISRFWNELPADQVEPLRAHLLKLVAEFSNGPRIVLTRLCVALSSFLLQTIPTLWPNVVQDLVTAFSHNGDLQLSPAHADAVLLEILTVLPEEFITAQLPAQRCHTVRNELKKGLPAVVQLLHGYLGQNQLPAYDQALHCFTSWAKFGLPYPEAEPTVELVFHALHDDLHFDKAVDTLVSIFSHPENYRFPQTMQQLLAHLVQTSDLFEKSVNERDMDMCQSLCRLIVMAADNNSKLLISLSLGDESQKQLALLVISLVLRCSAVPGYYPVDEQCSDFPFGFWYNFQDEIQAADGDRYVKLMQLYVPIYMQLINVLLAKVCIPPDAVYSLWSAEVKEVHRCYRQDIADTLMYVYNLLHDPLLGSLTQMLETVLSRAPIESVPWQEIETVLFALSALAEGVDISENVHMPVVFSMLARIPSSTSYTLINQALYFVGAFSEWLSEHPTMIGCVLPVLIHGLHDVSLAQSASMSLKDLVRECQLQLHPHAKDILTNIQEVIERNILQPRDAARLMSCVGYVLAILPHENIMEYLNILLMPHFDQLCQLVQVKPTPDVKAAILYQLGLFSAVFVSLNTDLDLSENNQDGKHQQQYIQQPPVKVRTEPQPIVLVLSKLLPVFHAIINVYVSDADIVSEICDTLKNSVKTLLGECASLLTDLTNLILRIYEECSHPVVLDITKTILVLFARDVEHKAVCQLLFTCICSRTLNRLSTSVAEHTDLLEEFMSFLAQISKKAGGLLEDPECDIPGLFRAGTVGIMMNEAPASKASSQFLAALLGMADQMPRVNAVVSSDGQRLVDCILRAVAGESPRANIDPMCDVLMALNQHHMASLKCFLEVAISRENFPSTRASAGDKLDFSRKILANRVNKRKMKEIVQEYTLLCRGLLGTEYAAQTASMVSNR